MKRIIIFLIALLIGGCASYISEQDAHDTWQWNNSNFGGINSAGSEFRTRSVTNNMCVITNFPSQKR
jgi:hypothetical protein